MGTRRMTSEKTGMGTGGAVATASVVPVALGAAAVVAVFVGACWYLLSDAPEDGAAANKATVTLAAPVPAAVTPAAVAPAQEPAPEPTAAPTTPVPDGASPAAPDAPAGSATGSDTGSATGTSLVAPTDAPALQAADTPAAVAAAPAAGALDPAVPRFDNWRVALDGEAVVAGRALAGAEIAVVVDGKDVALTTAGADGSFAALFTLPANPQPSLMYLEARADGKVWRSAQEIALAPIAGTAVASVAGGGAPSAPAALLLGEQGVEVQAPQGAAPAATVDVVLDAIAYAPNGDVQLSGKGAAGQSLRVYLDQVAVAEAPVSPSGQWHVALGDVAPGTYKLRLDQLDSAGKVTARFETPFKRDTAEALAALIAPNAQAAAPAGTAPQVGTAPVAGQAAPMSDLAAIPSVDAEPAGAATPAAPLAPAKVEQVTITVQPGYTLWGIARETFGDGVLYVQVYEANRDKIINPDLIYPGQVFSLPTGQ